ncbi:uncharacterized protein LOC144034748 isoform X2 [Vanacampus margaritifer]
MSAEAPEWSRDERRESATVNRRPSIVVLQNMLKKIPQSPFLSQQQAVAPSPSESNGLPTDGSRSNPDGVANVTADAELTQNGAYRSSPQPVASMNPFYSYHLESGYKYNGGEDVGQKPWQQADGNFVPLPEFKPSPLDRQENGVTVFDAQKDLLHTSSLNNELDSFLTSQSGSASGQFRNVSLSSPENTSENFFKSLHSKGSSMQDLVEVSPEDSGKVLNKPFSVLADPLWPSSDGEGDLRGSPKDPAGNLFYSASTNASHLFQTNGTKFSYDDKFTSSGLSGSDVDVFSPSLNASSPIAKELFRDGGSTSDKFNEKTPNSKDVFGTLAGGELARSTSDIPEWTAQSMYSDAPRDIVLTTPQGSKHGILQPTPFSQAGNLRVSPDSSPTELNHQVMLTRRTPKPFPRSRPPRPGKPPVPDKSLKPFYTVEPELSGPPKPPPKPSKVFPNADLGAISKHQEGKVLYPENSDVLEEILLIGQEKCVEDWPEDSPQYHPDFKPSGKLRLRRESLKARAYSVGGATGEDQDDAGVHVKKKDKKFLLLSKGASKDKLSDDMKDGHSWTLPPPGNTPKDGFYEMNFPSARREDGEQSWSEGKKKPLKKKVNQLLRRASTSLIQRHPTAGSKDDNLQNKRMAMKESTGRWHSQETMFDDSIGEEEAAARAQMGEPDAYTSKGKKKLKMKFTPQKGFNSSRAEEPQGAYGYTPNKDSKDRQKQVLGGADIWQQEPNFRDTAEIKRLHSISQEDVSVFHTRQKSLSAERLDYEALNAADDYTGKKNKFKPPVPLPRKAKPTLSSPGPGESGTFGHAACAQPSCADDWPDEDDVVLSGKQHGDPLVDYNYKQDELGLSKQKKGKRKVFRKHKAKKKTWDGSVEDVAVNQLSEAAQAEWLAAQKDERVAAGLEDSEGDGDTDSLMEWWNTVERWDEVASDEEAKQLDESDSFTVLADKVNRGLQVFNKVFTERAEIFWQHVMKLHALADHLSTFHQKAKAAGITGSTTAAVGGVTAIAGLALAPFTFGASLIVTAVGVGVATAGGITSASATISDNVNNIQERKKVEAVLQEYEFDFQGLADILHFVNHGLYKLRGHPFLRSGTQHYSEDWEVRKAVQMISLVDSPVMRAMEVTDANLYLVRGLQSGMDKYFKDSRTPKRAFKKEVVGRIKEAANMLNDGVVELNAIREELQKAIGNF